MNHQEVSELINSGQLALAIYESSSAMAQNAEGNNPAGVLEFTAQFVRANRMLGDYATGLAVGTQMVEEYGSGKTESSKVLVEVANIFRLQRDYDGATSVLLRAIDLSHSVKDNKTESQATWGLGVVYRLKREFTEATLCFSSALTLCQEIDYALGAAHCYREIGVTSRQNEKYEEAEEQLKFALALYESEGNVMGVAHCKRELGTVARLDNNPIRAVTLLCEALNEFQAIGARLGVANTYTELSATYYNAGNSLAGSICYELALSLYDELEDKEGAKYLQAVCAQYKNHNSN
ncbi:tetratricopeptide repeat protein [Candidatus Saccharibacteria bacterium]|nr:tetratricopeptide repeat protein [Candidatus Saccharibacteria bacterium]